MGSISSSGVGSGLDVAGIVTKLVEAEGKPQSTRLATQEAKAQAKLSALGSLRSALATFRDSLETLKDVDNFRGRDVVLSKPDFLAATASAKASPGSYAVEVQSLASAHRLASQTFTSASEVIGTGTLSIARGASSFTVTVAAGNDSVAAIAKAINDSTQNVGVSATVVTGVDGARLVLASTETGETNRIVVTQSGGDGGLVDLVYDPAGTGVTNLTELQAAADAHVLIDGFAVASPTNSIDGAVEGLTLDLLAANEVGKTTLVSVAFNPKSARATLDEFVKSYNALVDSIGSVASFDAKTHASGPLFGDAGVRNMVFQLRRELTASVAGMTGPFDMLNDIGITAQLDGKLSIDSARLDKAFAENFDSVGELFSAEETGLAVRLDATLEPYLQSSGVFDSRDESLKAQIDDIGDRRAALNQRLVALQARYTREFNALDSLLSQLQSTSGFLTQQLGNLPGSVFNGK